MLIGERYEVAGTLGAGGFGTTYAAVDRQTGRSVAVKVLDLRRVEDWKAVELFEREARVLRSLDHPGIPAYVEFRPLEAEREAYLVQSLAPGKTLQALLGERRFSEAELVDLTVRLLEILEYLGSRHPVVIHRDLKPANVLLADDGTVSLVDFGAVRDIAAPDGGSTVAGTFGYMAPEQLQGEASPASDLYGLGMTLVHLASGCEPSEFDKKRLKPDFRPHVHMSEAFEAFIDRLIEPIPDDRFATAREALDALREGERPAPALSSVKLADLLAQRTAARSRRDLDRAPERLPKKVAAEGHDRVSVEADREGITLAIRPAAYWRGREMHFGLLIVLGPLLATIVGGPIAGGTGITIGIVATVVLAVALWLTAPTWRLRVTDRGHAVLYTRNPSKPRWIGPAGAVGITIMGTRRGGSIAYVRVTATHEDLLTLYPIGPRDPGTLREFSGRLHS